MTLGEKITYLRGNANMSQETLAERLSVSRQSISKWEMDQTIPQIEKILLLSELFHVTTDELLIEKVSLSPSLSEAPVHHYFEAGGFLGEANAELTSVQAYRIGRFLGWFFGSALSDMPHPGSRPKIVIGKDTRRSSYMLEYSIVAGITASGADAYMLHVTTTPSIVFVTCQDEFDCGIMITGSGNPYFCNGIKLMDRYGGTMDASVLSYLEAYLDGNLSALGLSDPDLPLARRDRIGCIFDDIAGRNRYVGYLISLASNSYKSLRIGLDCANGASWMIARAVFDALGAQTFVIGNEPNGLNINTDCGSTHPEALCTLVREKHLNMGFAFDGDADSCIAVDENGRILDGNAILYILAHRLKNRDNLNEDTVVTSTPPDSPLCSVLKRDGITVKQVQPGHVFEMLQNNSFSLGGEPSGYLILKKYATLGDGILTAIMLTEEVCDRKVTLGKLAEPYLLSTASHDGPEISGSQD